MSSDVSIRVDGLSKCYQIYNSPSDRLKQFLLPKLRRLLHLKPVQYFRPFWAVDNVSFEVRRGETVGIIGRNGSGKSTLLEMVCGTLTPSRGAVTSNGRIAALLELGSGFNPEFSGKENIYLNAVVLGLSKAQVDAKYQDIVAFADIGDFIEQPVKTYSSGMLVRLAFAVIAHVDAEILIIDEALAVGDAVFTQKCMRFLRNHVKTGSLLFVSHDTNAVLSLCQKAVWMNRGKVEQSGDAQEVVEAYGLFTHQELTGGQYTLSELKPKQIVEELLSDKETLAVDEATSVSYFAQLDSSSGWETGKAVITSVKLLTDDGTAAQILKGGERVTLSLEAKALGAIRSPILGWFLKDRLGQSLFGEHTYTYTSPPLYLNPDDHAVATFQFRLPLLPNGEYSMTVSIAEGDPFTNTQHHWLHDAVIFKVESPVLRYGLVGIPFEQVTMRAVSAGEH
jgi:lipopolysaccharide transport system ATP-binding protein